MNSIESVVSGPTHQPRDTGRNCSLCPVSNEQLPNKKYITVTFLMPEPMAVE